MPHPGAPPPPPAARRRRHLRAGYSTGIVVMLTLALLSSILVMLRPGRPPEGLQVWSFARAHTDAYAPLVAEWNARNPDHPVEVRLFSGPALERRLLSGFRAGLPVADLVEVNGAPFGQTVSGPLSEVGFLDITDRLRDEGLFDQINAPSFSAWATRGRYFGIPHDVHPVLLAYRADIVEAAGIDLTRVETWDEYFAAMAPLMAERGPDGRPRRYTINFWHTNFMLEALLLQGGGGAFDREGRLALDAPANARILARLALWCTGPDRVAADAPEFSPSGTRLKLEGFVLSSLMPDWLTAIWVRDMPDMAGKWKLMPLPAWERGGLRTSVFGGTMIGIPRASPNIDRAWEFAKHLYTSPELWDRFFPASGVIPPVKALWDRPVFSAPHPFFSGQPVGRLYIEQAAHVPLRSSSPFLTVAQTRLGNTLTALVTFADDRRAYTVEALEPEARRLLALEQADVAERMRRNVFLREETP